MKPTLLWYQSLVSVKKHNDHYDLEILPYVCTWEKWNIYPPHIQMIMVALFIMAKQVETTQL